MEYEISADQQTELDEVIALIDVERDGYVEYKKQLASTRTLANPDKQSDLAEEAVTEMATWTANLVSAREILRDYNKKLNRLDAQVNPSHREYILGQIAIYKAVLNYAKSMI